VNFEARQLLKMKIIGGDPLTLGGKRPKYNTFVSNNLQIVPFFAIVAELLGFLRTATFLLWVEEESRVLPC